ncbi:class F sortase [Metabacillus litoralis]|uniref:class F sortase n=1 Tax=Metabacillus litoralis TaxID=152268 RepID=UPI001CFD954E|nr:class F sortase [Metabacillus litoralis]
MYRPLALTIFILLLSGCSAGAQLNEEQNSSSNTTKSTELQLSNNTTSEKLVQESQNQKGSKSRENETIEQGMSDSRGIVPTQIEIPSINVQASITKQGLNNKGQMIIPDNGEEVAWYEPGAQPGEEGNAVLAGHVDDYTGPAVFFYLKELKPGDDVIVYDAKGKKLLFRVEKIQSYPKDEAPLQKIFGPTTEPRLNLITCTGLYNRSTNEHEERLVVYTKMVS